MITLCCYLVVEVCGGWDMVAVCIWVVETTTYLVVSGYTCEGLKMCGTIFFVEGVCEGGNER